MKRKAAEVQTVPLAYIGPTIPGVATKGEVYTNGLPDALTAAATQKPLLNKLIVELTDMPNAQRDIILGRGVCYAAYQSVVRRK